MLRLSRLLFLLPVLVLVIVRWRTGSMPSMRLLFYMLMIMVLLGALVGWYGNQRALNGSYVPATLSNGRIVPGHGASP